MRKNVIKRIISVIMLCTLCFNTMLVLPITAAETITKYKSSELGEKRLQVEEDGVVIDGIKINKEEFKKGLSKLVKMPDTPLSVNLVEEGEQIADTAKKTTGLAAVGVGIKGIFERLNYGMFLAAISNKVPFVIPSFTFSGVKREITVVVVPKTGAIVIDGIAMGMNWMTYDIAKYLSEKQDTLKTVPSKETEKIDWDVDENKKKHVAKGSGKRHEEGWRRLGLNPNNPLDPKFWGPALALMKRVVSLGNRLPNKTLENGGIKEVYEYIIKMATDIEEGIKIIVEIYYGPDGEGKLIHILEDAYFKFFKNLK